MRVLSLVFLLSLLGCASQPQSTEVKQAVPAAQSPQSNPAQASIPTAAPVAVAAADADPSKFKVPSGYTQRTIDGETLYCRKETVLGSRFPKELCFNSAELQKHEIHNQEMRDRMQQSRGVCTGGSACVSP